MSTFPILLVDDDDLDVKTVKRAFEKASFSNPLFVARDGLDALDYLLRRGDYADKGEYECPTPGLILLDLNMPRMNGLQFLKKLRQTKGFETIQVVVLTTSKEDKDRIESYRLGVSGYIVKPLDFIQFVDVSKTLNAYWSLCELP